MYKKKADKAPESNVKTVPCNLKPCNRNVCNFAHSAQELVPRICRFDKTCANNFCTRKHSEQTMTEYAEANGWKFEDAKPVEKVVEVVPEVVEVVPEIVEVVPEVIEAEKLDVVFLEKVSRHLENVRLVLLERYSIEYEVEVKKRNIRNEIQDIDNQRDILDAIEKEQIAKTISRQELEEFTFLEFIHHMQVWDYHETGDDFESEMVPDDLNHPDYVHYIC